MVLLSNKVWHSFADPLAIIMQWFKLKFAYKERSQ